MQKAILGLGCFWEPEKKFSLIKGVTKTEVGYCGGNSPITTYKEVCSDKTNHAEVVNIEFDENIITYEKIVRLFFEMHDPTTLNRQGPNAGSQYRSEIFYNSEEQREIAKGILKELSKRFNNKIVTKISKVLNYCKAEEYHQKYFQKKN